MPITKATASSIAPAAKGDLVVGSATNDASVLAVGTNGFALVAASGESTGLKWAASPNFVGCATYLNTTAAITPSTATFLSMTEDIDTNGFHSDSVNPERITIPSGFAGKYLVTWGANWTSSSANKESGIFKNTAGYQVAILDSGRQLISGALILDLAEGDYIRQYCYNYDTVNVNVFGSSSGNPRCSFLSVQYLGA